MFSFGSAFLGEHKNYLHYAQTLEYFYLLFSLAKKVDILVVVMALMVVMVDGEVLLQVLQV